MPGLPWSISLPAVLEAARKIGAADTKRKKTIDEGVTIADLMQRKYK